MDLPHRHSPATEAVGPMEHREDMETSPRKTLLVAGLRCTTAALAIVSTRHLMYKGFHYPYHLLLVHSLAVLLFQAGSRLLMAFRRDQHTTQDRYERCSGHTGIKRGLVLLLPLLHMACMVGTLLCVYQATYHIAALPILAMLLILDWSSIFTISDRLPGRGLALAFISMIGMAMMFMFDRKLAKGGIIGSAVAILLISLSRFMDVWMSQICGQHKDYSCMRWKGAYAIPVSVVMISPALLRRYEHPIYTPVSPVSLGGIMALNIICVVAAWWCNRSCFTQTEVSDHTLSSEYISEKELKYLITPLAFVGLVTAGSSSFDYPLFPMSAWQHAGFLIALSAIYVASYSPGHTIVGDTEKNYELLSDTDIREEPDATTSKASPKRMPLTLAITLVAAVLCFLTPMLWADSRSEPQRATLRSFFTPRPREDGPYSLDFVVSRYAESASLLASNLQPLLELKATQDRAVRIVVYDTGEEDRNSSFREELQHALRSPTDIVVEHRPNVGREGAAFLHHITSRWNDLAHHTLFMQAGLHQPRHVRRLLRNYFVPQTGFLSLVSSRDSCSSCDGCWDHSAWSESQTIMENIYSRANHGSKCKDFYLTYRGQFVASRNRIQSPGKALFEDLLGDIANPKSDKHSKEYVNQPWLPAKIDSMNAPLFGYTLERIWGVLMGCSNSRLALTCPSRLSASMAVLKVGSSPRLSDCQCLDDTS